MAKDGVLGNGTKVAFGTTQGVWTELEDPIDVVFPTWEADDVNNDVHSPTNKLHRTMPGMIKVGNPSVTVRSDLDPATSPEQETLREANEDGTNLWWRFEVPVNRAKTLFRGAEFQAGVKTFVPGTPIADRQTTVYTLLFDGENIFWDASAGASEI